MIKFVSYNCYDFGDVYGTYCFVHKINKPVLFYHNCDATWYDNWKDFKKHEPHYAELAESINTFNKGELHVL